MLKIVLLFSVGFSRFIYKLLYLVDFDSAFFEGYFLIINIISEDVV